MEVAHMDQPKDMTEREERDTGFTNARKSGVSHPIAPLWGKGCFTCSLGSNGEHPKTRCCRWAARLLAPAHMWGTGSRACTLKECSGTPRGTHAWKLHRCGPRFVRGEVTALSQSVPILFLIIHKHKQSKCSRAGTLSQTKLHLI